MNFRNRIQGIEDSKTEAVTIPEWENMTLYVRGMTGNERDKYEKSILVSKGKKFEVNMEGARARLIVLTTVDENGDHVFNDGDEEWLGKKSGAALSRLVNVAARLSGITDEDMGELVG